MKIFISILVLCFLCYSAPTYNNHSWSSASLSHADCQEAIDSCDDGDTVVYPSDTIYRNDARDTIANKAITVRGNGSENTFLIDTTTAGIGFFYINQSIGKNFVVSGMHFKGKNKTSVFVLGKAKAWRINNCKFESTIVQDGITVGALDYNQSTYGVIDNCQFESSRILVRDDYDGHASWKALLDIGGSTAVYIENCKFTRWTSLINAVDDNNGGRYVLRYDTTVNVYTEAHSTQNPLGVSFAAGNRKTEVYNCVFQAVDNYDPAPSNYLAIRLRAGTGVIFNNIVDNQVGGEPYSGICGLDNVRSMETRGSPLLTCDGTNILDGNTTPSDSGWPCINQIGRSTDHGAGDEYQRQDSVPLYSWNNIMDGNPSEPIVISGYRNPLHIKEGRDYINDEPPWYTAYTYPHPATGRAASMSASSLKHSSGNSGLDTLIGNGFQTQQGRGKVCVGVHDSVASIIYWSDDTIIFDLPNFINGDRTVWVLNNDFQVDSSLTYTFNESTPNNRIINLWGKR